MEILNKLQEILSETKGEAVQLTMETTFADLELDSLDQVDIVMQLEEFYNISLGENAQLSTVGELVAKIEEAMQAKGQKRIDGR